MERGRRPTRHQARTGRLNLSLRNSIPISILPNLDLRSNSTGTAANIPPKDRLEGPQGIHRKIILLTTPLLRIKEAILLHNLHTSSSRLNILSILATQAVADLPLLTHITTRDPPLVRILLHLLTVHHRTEEILVGIRSLPANSSSHPSCRVPASDTSTRRRTTRSSDAIATVKATQRRLTRRPHTSSSNIRCRKHPLS